MIVILGSGSGLLFWWFMYFRIVSLTPFPLLSENLHRAQIPRELENHYIMNENVMIHIKLNPSKEGNGQLEGFSENYREKEKIVTC